ncbi:hypothetical protein [Clostridium botulinum]|uniref:hypothetical protein n=1 Tax=Clostridium botulinum TaxID=1491 RepID=UPI0009477B29|nr:hypothetical protein [Clostridium botulinum]APQ97687.1 hypothetical protein RSJ3_1282 [Clostridium botulinum]MBN3362127.1 hypothetical protein [Clostridium botulinum]
MKELTLKDLQKLDTIEVTNKQLEKEITRWCELNKSKINSNKDMLMHIFDEGIIKIKDIVSYKKSDSYIHFKIIYTEKIKTVQLNEYYLNESKNLIYISTYIPHLSMEKHIESFVSQKPVVFNREIYINKLLGNIDDDDVKKDVQNNLNLYYSILFYLQLNQETIIRQARTHTKKIQAKKDKRKGKKPRVKLIRQNIIKLNTDHIQLTEEERMHYDRHTFGWTVRGHWREYKSGKKVWIKPQVRGDKSKIEGKIYEV